MIIAIFLNTPAQVHFYKNIWRKLRDDGHKVYLIARDYGETIPLLKEMNIDHFQYLSPPESKIGKVLSLPFAVIRVNRYLKNKKVDLITGFGVYDVLVSILRRKPVIVFSDSEPRINKKTFSIQFDLLKPFTNLFITPSSFGQDMGKNHRKINSFKELAYLHPKYYSPSGDIYSLLGIEKGEKFIILRFNAFDALHDAGVTGFSDDMKIKMVREFSKKCHVFISSEKGIPDEIKDHVLDIPKSRIHDVLSYAHLLITDTQTMTTEAALLGTPVVRCNSWVGDNDMGNFIELENKYKMIYNFNNEKLSFEKANELINKDDINEIYDRRRDLLLEDKVDIVDKYCEIIYEFNN